MNEIRLVSVNTEISRLNNLEIKHSEKLQNRYLKTDWAGTIKKNTAHFRDAINTQKDLLINLTFAPNFAGKILKTPICKR